MLLDLVATYGYAVVTLFVLAEGVGVPLPGETALVIAAAVAAQGRLSLVGVIVAATLGGVLGGSGGYWIGRTGLLSLIQRRAHWIPLHEKRLEEVRRFFERYGALTIFFGRFVAFVRTAVSLAAGLARMPFARFATYNALGALLWAGVVGGTGYFFGESIRLRRGLGRAGLAVALLLALVTVLAVGWRWFRANGELLVRWIWRVWERAAARALPRLRAVYPRVWSFLTARFMRGQYLGLHLTVGLAVSFFFLWIFAAVTEDVLSQYSLSRFDVVLSQWFRSHATHTGDAIFDAVTQLGSASVVAFLVAAVTVILGLRRQWIALAGWIAAAVGGSALSVALKPLIQRPRPAVATMELDSFSFPSGHAMGSLVAYGMLAYLLLLRATRPGLRLTIIAAAGLLIIAIGFSRLYLAVHYFSDVVAGYAAGTVWLSACISGLEIVRRRPA